MNKYNLTLLTETPEKAFEYAKSLGLIKIDNKFCELCQTILVIEKGKTRHGIDIRLRCKKRACRKNYSIFKNSIFDDTHLKFWQVFSLIYSFAIKETLKNAAHEASVHETTAGEWFNYFHKLVFKKAQVIDWVIMNANDIYEVDETHIYTRKYNQGRILKSEQYWAIVILNRNTKEVRITINTKRTKKIINPFIQQYIPYGARIITDGWSGYIDLGNLGYQHNIINHTLNFIDPEDPTIHTQNVERFHRSLKESIPNSTPFNLLDSKIKKFQYFHNLKIRSRDEQYNIIIDLIKAEFI